MGRGGGWAVARGVCVGGGGAEVSRGSQKGCVPALLHEHHQDQHALQFVTAGKALWKCLSSSV
eukprot:358621-Chlamydomonas_euryale.AAC.5